MPVPFLAIGFGFITMCTSFIHSYGAFVAIRTLLGVCEAGIMPGITYTLSCLYVYLHLLAVTSADNIIATAVMSL